MSKSSNIRARKYRLLLYPDCPQHMSALDLIRNDGVKYALILHDKDMLDGELKKPHYHVDIWYDNARYLSPILQWLGIESNYIQVSNNATHDLRYLIHKDDPDKYQYSIDDVETNMRDEVDKAVVDASEEDRVLALLDLLDGIDSAVSTASYIRLICNAGMYDIYRRCQYTYMQVLREHNSRFALEMAQTEDYRNLQRRHNELYERYFELKKELDSLTGASEILPY